MKFGNPNQKFWEWDRPLRPNQHNPNTTKGTLPPPCPFDLMHKIKLLKEENARLREENAELRLNKR